MSAVRAIRVDAARWPVILTIVGAGVVSAFQVGKASMALTAIRTDLGLDLATASWLLSAFAIVGALVSIVIGMTVDRLGARRMVVIGLLLQGGCSALGAFSEGATLLLATRILEGMGFLAVVVAAPALILAVARPEQRERAFAAWATFMPLGMTLVMLGAPLLTLLGWRGFWLLNAALLASYAGLLMLGPLRGTSPEASRHGLMEDVRTTLAARGPWLLAGLFTAYAAMYFAVFGFLPSLLASELMLSEERGNLLTAGALAASAIGCLAGGQLLAKGLRPRRILVTGFVAMTLCGSGIFTGYLPGSIAYALSIVFAFIGGFIPVVLINGVPQHAPRPELVGATMGFLMQGNNLGLVVGPAAAGALAGAMGWPPVSLLLGALALAALFLTLALRARPGGESQ